MLQSDGEKSTREENKGKKEKLLDSCTKRKVMGGGDFTVVAVSLLNEVAMTTVYQSSSNRSYVVLCKRAYM